MAALRVLRAVLLAGALAAAALFLAEYLRPSVLLVGNVTIDVVDKKHALGGAASYAAAVLTAFGIRACIVTAAGPDADLSAFEGHELHVVPSEETLTFEHTYTWWGNKRKLRVLAQPGAPLSWAHVPPHCRSARTILLGPLTPTDVDCASFVRQPTGSLLAWLGMHQHIGFMAQGLQRDLDAAGRVIPKSQPSTQLLDALGPEVFVFLSDVETDVWEPQTVANLSFRSARWLVTRGEAGADEWDRGRLHRLPPHKVEAAVDTNGAGDTFATAYMLATASRWPSPGSFANWAASRAVELPQAGAEVGSGRVQACKPHCVATGLHADSTFAQVAQWLSHSLQHAEEETKEMLEAAQGGLSHLGGGLSRLRGWQQLQAGLRQLLASAPGRQLQGLWGRLRRP